jgi:hypothetical protein
LSIALPAVVVVAILGGGFLALAGHVLSSSEFTEFLAVWGLVSLVGTVLASLEWEVSRATATRIENAEPHGSPMRRAPSAFLPVTIWAAAIATLAMLILCIWAVPTILRGSWLAAFFLLLGVAGIPFQASTRGILAGQRRVRQFSAVLVGEVLIRLVLAPVLLIIDADIVGWIAVLAAGSWAWLLVAPRLLFTGSSIGGGVTARQVASKFGTLIIGAISYAAMLMAYPTILAAVDANEHPTYVAALGSALVLSRLPALLVLPLLPLLISYLVRREGSASIRWPIILLVMSGLTSLILIGSALGPAAIRIAFGDRYELTGWTFGALLASCLLLVLTSVLSSDVVARGHHVLSSGAWLIGAAATGTLLIFMSVDVGVLYPIAILFGSALALALMALSAWTASA